ncbi:tetratricopeptide repeat protein [Desulfobotulus alkaliphilus]|uniref:Tetratricopeptide repeat protein n=1 Tax=Desulfobotulus alkaliphilus TaxID=622671 RepID=A0A562S6I0_9BACT|nr:tetratricopeptide repeat protein [Desulfobotulus alkaliphilus]TWI76798.1 tetratricopeptide repeat protein [Desulfobotulus alkaliphilus]
MKKYSLIPLALLAFIILLPSCGGKKEMPVIPEWEQQAHRSLRHGNAAYHKGCYLLASRYYQAALEGFTTADNTYGTALALNNLGNTFRMRHQYDDALACYEEAGQRASRRGEKNLEMLSTANRISLLLDMNRADEAASILEKIADRETFPVFRRPEARLLDLSARQKEAEELLKTALHGAGPVEKAGLYFTLGNILLEQNRAEEAREAFIKALGLDKAAGRFGATASDLMALARCDFLMENYTEAYDSARRAMEIWSLTGAAHEVAEHKAFFMELSEKSGADTSLSLHFIKIWLAGRAIAGPCD